MVTQLLPVSKRESNNNNNVEYKNRVLQWTGW